MIIGTFLCAYNATISFMLNGHEVQVITRLYSQIQWTI